MLWCKGVFNKIHRNCLEINRKQWKSKSWKMLHGIFGVFNGWRMRLRHGFVLTFMIKWFHLLTPGFDSKFLINFTLHLKIKFKKQQQIRKKSNPLFYFWSVIVSSKKDKMHQNHHQCTRLFISNYKQMFLHPNLCIYIRDEKQDRESGVAPSSSRSSGQPASTET